MRRITALLASVILAAGAAQARSAHAAPRRAQAAAAGVAVPLDEVRLVAFVKPISTLYIGNPVIADVTMIDKRHAFVLGKSFGATNMIALDASGTQISNQQVIVFGSASGAVTLQRGAARVTYSCAAARCEPSPQPGDGKDPFDSSMDQIAKHQALVSKLASGQAQ
ncbi:MAG: pilus assembly protein N-terminal domain-containing protein [Alphaproteobacteria bacterium]|nr:pilus assembly protein N-terminal domain-containing protein [Alphaproteobacteria bacterium]